MNDEEKRKTVKSLLLRKAKIRKEITIRDKRKDIQYFNRFIDEETKRVKFFTKNLKNGKVNPERIRSVKSTIHDLKLGIMIAKYSRGDDLSILEKEYLDLLDGWKDIWEPDYYNKNLKMISLGVLFDADRIFATQIREMLGKAGINDWLFHFLLDSWDHEQTSGDCELLFPKSFSRLQKVTSAEDKVEVLKKYLSDDWYHKDCGCYEAHKSKQNIYYGYWSFEAGAVSRILNVDDSSLKDAPYYPYDLVHYKRW